MIDWVFTTTFTFSMNIQSQIYLCYTFTDILYTAIFQDKKINIVPKYSS